MSLVGRDLPLPILHHGQGCHPVDQAVQVLIQPGLEQLQGGTSTASLRSLCECFFLECFNHCIIGTNWILTELHLSIFSYSGGSRYSLVHSTAWENFRPHSLALFCSDNLEYSVVLAAVFFTVGKNAITT